MGSFVALYVEGCEERQLVSALEDWLRPQGFDPAEDYDAVPHVLWGMRIRPATAVGCERLNDSWHIVFFNSFTLKGGDVDAVRVRPLVERLAARALLFTAQTTSDVYTLILFQGSKVLRSVHSQEGTLLENEGDPLPGERAGAFSWSPLPNGDDPPGEVDDASKICEALGFELWATPSLRGRGRIWRRRGFLSRLFGG